VAVTRKRDVREGYETIAKTYLDNRDTEGPERDLMGRFAGDLADGSCVLDADCGAGIPATAALAGEHEVVGLDAAGEQVALAREHVSGARLVQGDLVRLPFAAGTFDGVVSLHAVIHVPRETHGEVFQEFHRVLRPGGRLLVTVGTTAWEGRNPDWLDSGAEMFWSFHGRERSLELLRDAGFSVECEMSLGDDLSDGEWLFVHARAER
jgi:SAM-dependent methyltransferase